MKNLEDKYNSKTVAELSLSPRKEMPPISRSLLLDMEAEGASEKRVQILEDRLNTVRKFLGTWIDSKVHESF